MFRKIDASGDRVAGFTVAGDSYCELQSKLRQVNNAVKVMSADNKDIMRHDLLEEAEY